MITCSVYWIRAQYHSDFKTEGYIGVARDANKRWKYGHFWSHKNNRHDNPKFANAIAKHGWDNLIKEILVIAPEDYCYDLESKIRSSEDIGWNIAIGGHKPPVSKYRGSDYVSPLKGKKRETPWMFGRIPANKGKTASDEAKAKMSAAGKGKKNTPEHLAKRMESRRLTRIARGQIRPFIVNGVQYESSRVASEAIGIPEATLKYWAYGNGKPSAKYAHITEVRWV
jgi:group I intron endonuclease